MRELSLSELSEDISEVKLRLNEISRQMEALPFMRRDLWESERANIRDNLRLTLINTESSIKNVENKLENVRAIAMWSLGLICTTTIGAIIAFIATFARG